MSNLEPNSRSPGNVARRLQRRRSIQQVAWLCVTLALHVARPAGARAADAGNFICDDRELAAACEQARRDSARFWSGAELPGSWTRPCPVSVSPASHDGGGATSFQFDRGEVTGWRMTLRGRRESLLADVAPHEVDHMVRASLVRRPITRWLDEGCATLFESPESHQRYRERLSQWLSRPPDAAFLDAREYPADPAGLERLYTVGFSSVEFLLDQRDAAALLAFQADPRPPTAKLAEHYGLRPEQFGERWRDWAVHRAARGTDCQSVDCARHGLVAESTCGCRDPRLPVLTIYTASWCQPCRQFWSDLRSDASFRLAITQRFHIHTVDVDRNLPVSAPRVEAVPTFRTPFGSITGYEGKLWLLQRLGLSTAEPPAAAPAPVLDMPVLGTPSPVAPDLTAPGRSDGRLKTPPETGRSPNPGAVPLGPTAVGGMKVESPQRTSWLKNAIEQLLPAVFGGLGFAGVIGGTAATGGAGMLAVMAVRWVLQWRRRRRSSNPDVSEAPPISRSPTFSRDLAEARQLLQLRRSEECAEVVDALRGMFLNDELDKLDAAQDPAATALAAKLRSAINSRVEEVAPVQSSVQTGLLSPSLNTSPLSLP